MLPEPLPDIAALVKEHAYRAMVLSGIEVLPPGYTRTDWAVLLMDNDYTRLQTRYARKVTAEQERLENLVQGFSEGELYARMGVQGVDYMPASSRNPPPDLVAKSREVYAKWLGKLVEQECLNALQPLVGKKRDVSVLMKAQDILRETLASLTEMVGQMPYTATVTMSKDGGFDLTVREKPPSRSLR